MAAHDGGRDDGGFWRLAGQFALGVLRLAWNALRLPLLALLVVLEPIATMVLTLLSMLALFTAFLFEFACPRGDFPFWGMIGFSAATALTIAVYYGLIRLLSMR